MRKIVLRNFQSPGDVVMLTAAVRDLHRSLPGRFLTDVRTACPALWEHNPYISKLEEEAPDVEILDCNYPLIQEANTTPHHFIHGFRMNLEDELGIKIKAGDFKGDIHLSDSEKSWYSKIRELGGIDLPFWIIVAGGKYDFTAKWWDVQRYQKVVDHFKDKILFVQVGESGHYHPRLNGVVDLVGKTDLRQLVRLIYHAQGVLCGVTLHMHLAAAIETKGGFPKNRPCVVVAGGREPAQWEAYPHHQYIHRNGALPCCDNGGCWKSRVKALGDGDEKDADLCVDPVGNLPRCMDMIPAREVIERIALYFRGGVCRYLSPVEQGPAARAINRSLKARAKEEARYLDIRSAAHRKKMRAI